MKLSYQEVLHLDKVLLNNNDSYIRRLILTYLFSLFQVSLYFSLLKDRKSETSPRWVR